MQRLQVVLGHLKGRPHSGPEPAPRAAPCWSSTRRPADEDVVVVHGRRTAIGRAGRGGFKVRPLGPGAGCEAAARAGWGLAPLFGSPRLRRCLRAQAVTNPLWSGDGGAGVPEPRAPPAGGSPRPRFPLQDTTPDELLSAVMTAVLQDVKLSPAQLGDICVGEHTTQAVRSVLLAFPSRQGPPQTPSHPLGTF